MPSFEDLPFEIVSEILTIAADLNARDPDAVTYTYGLTQAGRPSRLTSPVQKYLRGRVPPDLLRWNSVDSFRLVNSRWHQWALSYALKELYIRRWRGGETWMRKAFEENNKEAAARVVYQDAYKSVRSTANLFHDYPSLALHVRRIWFNGIYRFDTIPYVFKILENCHNVRTVSIPWTALRYGTTEDWSNVMSFPRLTSLEFMAVALKQEICDNPNSANNTEILHSSTANLDFSNLRRLKFFGDSNLMPISDDDLLLISRTATNLEEIHISNMTSITAKGVAALVNASKNSLKLLEFTPLAKDGFEHPVSPSANDQPHICALISSCPRLQDLAITLPACCPELFSNRQVRWQDTVRIRVGAAVATPVEDLQAVLDSARELIEAKNNGLEIEIAIGNYLCETKARLVHGNYRVPKVLSEMRWEPLEAPSVKGPYGYTGLYGEDMLKGEWTCIGEMDFLMAMREGLVRV